MRSLLLPSLPLLPSLLLLPLLICYVGRRGEEDAQREGKRDEGHTQQQQERPDIVQDLKGRRRRAADGTRYHGRAQYAPLCAVGGERRVVDGGENGAIRYSRYNRYLHKQVDERPEFERSVTAVTTVTSTSRCTSAPNLSEPRKKKSIRVKSAITTMARITWK